MFRVRKRKKPLAEFTCAHSPGSVLLSVCTSRADSSLIWGNFCRGLSACLGAEVLLQISKAPPRCRRPSLFMEPVYASLAERALAALDKLLPSVPSPRLLVGLAGPPGSGKTTTAAAVALLINGTLRSPPPGGPPTAGVVAMDGFHLPRAALAAMPNAAEAVYRRGASFTFDGEGVAAFVAAARDPAVARQAPSFDHAVKDPVPGGTVIPAGTRIVIFEGNYLLADEEPWSRAAAVMGEKWFLDVDDAVARERLAARHVAAGIVEDHAAGLARAEGNDLPNGRWIREHLVAVDAQVRSIDEPMVTT